jgi:hypothetical protein
VSITLAIDDEQADELIARLYERLERPRWTHIEGLADYLGCEVRRIRALRERGLPARRLEGERKLIFNLDEVDEWLDRETIRV